jgi:uncharacterized integral membrane protein
MSGQNLTSLSTVSIWLHVYFRSGLHILLLIIILYNMSRVSSHYHLQYLPHLGVWRLPLQISSLVLWPFLSAILFVIGTCYIDQGKYVDLI